MVAVTNIAAGPRGLHTLTGFVLIERGASVTVDLDDAERASAEGTGYFEFEEADETDDGPVDDLSSLTVAQLKEAAAAEGVDLGDATRKADIAAAIRAARADKEG